METLPAYLMHDQPMCCPMCGRRTEWLGDEPQLHWCTCGYRFFLFEDEDFGFVELENGWVKDQELP